jgi:hypothetical protein
VDWRWHGRWGRMSSRCYSESSQQRVIRQGNDGQNAPENVCAEKTGMSWLCLIRTSDQTALASIIHSPPRRQHATILLKTILTFNQNRSGAFLQCSLSGDTSRCLSRPLPARRSSPSLCYSSTSILLPLLTLLLLLLLLRLLWGFFRALDAFPASKIEGKP